MPMQEWNIPDYSQNTRAKIPINIMEGPGLKHALLILTWTELNFGTFVV